MATSTEPSDEALVRLALIQPQSNAFEQLIKRHQSRLRLYLRSLTGNQAVADELAQESLLKVHRALSQFKFQSSFKTWLMRIARNTFLDHVRVASQVADFQGAAIDCSLNAIETQTMQSSERQNMLAIDIDRSLQWLSSAEREVIAHCYFADLSMAETSQILGMPIGTVKTHSQRGLKKLREALSAWQSTSKGKDSQ